MTGSDKNRDIASSDAAARNFLKQHEVLFQGGGPP